jgi:hypothetical protein
VLAAPPAAAPAGVQLEVGGAVIVADDELQAQVDLKNRGDTAARSLTVLGELLGEHDEAVVAPPLEPGGMHRVSLRFPVSDPRPGVHVLPLRLDYTPEGANPTSQRAYLLVALGENVPPAIRLEVFDTQLRDRAFVRVKTASTDGRSHAVRLRVHTPRGLNPHGDPVELVVPAQGEAEALLPILRGAAPRPSLQGVLVSAATVEAPIRTTVSTGKVRVLPDPALMPKLRRPLAFLALALAVVCVIAEVRRRLQRSAA